MHGRNPILNNLLKRSSLSIAHGSNDQRLRINLFLYQVWDKIGPQSCKVTLTFQMERKKFLPHTGSSSDYKSIVEEEKYIARRIDIRKRKQACLFSAIHPMNVTMVTTHVEKNHERLHEKRRSVQKTHFCFDLAASLETVVKRKMIHKATF